MWSPDDEEELWRMSHRDDLFQLKESLTVPGRIRFCYIRPGRYDDPIIISYFTEWHDRTKPYSALSYVWGSPTPSKRIWVEVVGGLNWKPVTPNLEAALRRIRASCRPTPFWIDALCINQDEGNPEKAVQIKQMDKIYSNAEKVYVWLGPERDNSTAAMTFVQSIVNLPKLDELVSDRSYRDQWRAFGALMRRPWFSRRWVVQELALAKSADVICGEMTVSWTDFADAVALFEAKSLEIQKLFDNDTYVLGEIQGLGAHSLMAASQNLFAHSMENAGDRRLATLEYLISTLSAFEVSNPWDAVYALLSLAKEDSPIVVDYERPIIKVLRDVVMHIISTSGSIDIICRPWAPTIAQIRTWSNNNERSTSLFPKGRDTLTPELLPSYIRDTTESEFGPRSDKVSVQFDRINANRFVGYPGRTIYNTCASTTAKFRRHEDMDFVPFTSKPLLSVVSTILIFKGFKLESITSDGIGGYAHRGNIPPDWPAMGGWENHHSSPAPDSFWRTLVGDRGLDGARPPIWYRRACEHAWSESASPGLDTERVLRSSESTITGEFIKRVRETVWNRQMFITKHRRLLGLGPSSSRSSRLVKEGDMIFVLQGCSVPVILRQDGTRYYFRLIGECYVSGVMDGEAVTEYSKAGLEWKDIWIR